MNQMFQLKDKGQQLEFTKKKKKMITRDTKKSAYRKIESKTMEKNITSKH